MLNEECIAIGLYIHIIKDLYIKLGKDRRYCNRRYL